jgi:hypothetical protein
LTVLDSDQRGDRFNIEVKGCFQGRIVDHVRQSLGKAGIVLAINGERRNDFGDLLHGGHNRGLGLARPLAKNNVSIRRFFLGSTPNSVFGLKVSLSRPARRRLMFHINPRFRIICIIVVAGNPMEYQSSLSSN